MYAIDPDAGLQAADQPEPAAAAAVESAAATPDPEAEMLAAMDKGVEEATPQDEPEPVPGSNEAAEAERAAADKATQPDDKQPAPDKDTEDEIAALGLKEKSAARFRELTAEVKALAPIREQLEKAGIKDVAELPRLVRDAQDGADLVKMVQGTGADPEQFGLTLDYLSAVSAASKGDRAAGEAAWTMWLSEGKALAQALNKEMPGVFDPLAAHDDLADAVEKGDMSRQHALEVAHARSHQQALSQHRQRTQEQERVTQVQQQAVQQGIASLQQWEQQAMAKDPDYAAKRPALNAKVAEIRQMLPPAQWAYATELAYQAIRASAPAPAPKLPTPGPVRPGGPRPTMAPTTFNSVEDALDYGINLASTG